MYPLQKDLKLTGTFTETQKAAIVNLLYKVGGADGELCDEESFMIAKCNQVLKIDLNDKNSNILINRMFAYTLDRLVEVVKPLSREHREFILRSAYDVHNAGRLVIEKTDVVLAICKGLAINPTEFTTIVTQSDEKPLSYRDTPQVKREEAAGKILFDYLEQSEKKKNKSGCLGLILFIVALIGFFII